MAEERQETIEDIVDDIRAQNQGLPEDSYALSPLVCDLLIIADRIEAAMRHQFREVTKMIQHEEAAVSKMETTTPTREKSSAVGNAAAMREALEAAIPIMRACLFDYYNTTDINKVVGEMKAALAAPPRNCDVGTADEQSDRFDKFCYSHSKCYQCPVQSIWNSTHRQKRLREIIRCEIIWSQMPYEEASEMKDYSNVRAVCFDCARKAGFVQKNKAVIAFEDECGICKARRPCTDLRNDWMPPKKESDVK